MSTLLLLRLVLSSLILIFSNADTTTTTNQATTSQHLSIDFTPLPDGTAYTVDLERASVAPEHHATFFMALKAVHAKLRRFDGHDDASLNSYSPTTTTTTTTTTTGKSPPSVLLRSKYESSTATTAKKQHRHQLRHATSLGLIEEDDEPLQQQVLSQKRLATYYGTVQLGQCIDKDHKKTIACVGKQKEELTFKMLFDTGSCEFWVPGVGCTKDPKYQERCANHRTFNPDQSDSYKYKFGGKN